MLTANLDIMQKIKIAYFINIDNHEIGGAEYHVVDLANNLNKNLFKIYIISTNKDYLNLFDTHVQKHYLDDTAKEYTLKLTYHLYKCLKKIKPDIIHSHKLKASAWGNFVGWLLHTPVILNTIHSSPLDWEMPFWRKNFNAFLCSASTNLFATKTIALSKTEALKKQKKEHVLKNKIKIIYNSVNFPIQNFKRVHKSPDETIVIGSIGRLSIQKGHEYLIKAFPYILAQYKNVTCLIVGDGPLKNDLINLSKKLGVSDYIEFAGQVPKKEIFEYLKRINIFILPSLWELISYAIIEAMFMELPIIVSDIEELKEVIKDNQTGIMVKKKNPKDIAEKVIKLIEDPEKRLNLGSNAKMLAEKMFTGHRMIDEYEKLYTSFFQNRKGFSYFMEY